MKKKKGMTLVEVMVAMLILSFAALGGVAFFVNAFKVNYNYMDFAFRLDHALRYVERIKIQRKNYPTYGAFPNLGATEGFTIFFVDSEPDDQWAADPYFLENYSASAVNVAGTAYPYVPYGNQEYRLSVSTGPPGNGAAQGAGNPDNISHSSTAMLREYFSSKYAQGTYATFPGAWSYNYTTAGAPQMFISVSYNANIALPINNNAFHVLYDVPYTPLTQYIRSNARYTANLTIPLRYYVAEAQPWLTFRHYTSYSYLYIYTNHYNTASIPTASTTYGAHVGYWVGYSTIRPIDPPADLDGNPDSLTDYGNPEIITASLARFYTALPTNDTQFMNNFVAQSNGYPSFPPTYYYTVGESMTVPPDRYFYVGYFYTGDRGGLYLSYAWRYSVYQVTNYSYNSTSSVVSYLYSYFTDKTTSASHLSVNPGPNTLNKLRAARYRKSIYISVYPVTKNGENNVSSVEEAISIVRNIINTYSNLNDRVNALKAFANKSEHKYKTIVIPFMNLYADNVNSTLSEDIFQ
ncbi:MAG: prepilin-type N-terminal cleavage/methylation domain-containing protein [Endomicrobium sp.]|jgi:prepilin-type N-terminal cleavage/methylation domain-containing protein|nr:prepilin-type N-terminal cleavage/methylation domain-containing protein [Endomicrobium sp.]